MVMNDMTDDGKWGAEIAVDGCPPFHLLAGQWRWSEDGKKFTTAFSNSNAGYEWSDFTHIKLPADHPHYQQTQTIDWSAPIEAVHEDGRVVPASFHLDDGTEISPIQVSWHNQPVSWCRRNGRSLTVGWRIRNVQPATQAQAQTLTAQERLERMEAFVRKCHAVTDYVNPDHSMPFVGLAVTEDEKWLAAEARALVAEMEPVVDGDLVAARDVAVRFIDGPQSEIFDGGWDSHDVVCACLSAIKRGRELARGEG